MCCLVVGLLPPPLLLIFLKLLHSNRRSAVTHIQQTLANSCRLQSHVLLDKVAVDAMYGGLSYGSSTLHYHKSVTQAWRGGTRQYHHLYVNQGWQ